MPSAAELGYQVAKELNTAHASGSEILDLKALVTEILDLRAWNLGSEILDLKALASEILDLRAWKLGSEIFRSEE